MVKLVFFTVMSWFEVLGFIILLLAVFVSGCTEQYWVDNSSAKSLQIHQCVTQSGDFTLSL